MEESEQQRKDRLSRAESNFRRGEFALKSGDVFQAEVAFLEACRGNPEPPEHRALLAWTKFLKPVGDRTAVAKMAQEVLDEVLMAKPDYARGHYLLGEVWKFQKDLARAEECYRAALAVDPNLAEAKRELAAVSSQLARGGESRTTTGSVSITPAAKGGAAADGRTTQSSGRQTRRKPRRVSDLYEDMETALETPGKVPRMGRATSTARFVFAALALIALGVSIALLIDTRPPPIDPSIQVTIPVLKASAPNRTPPAPQ
jgi:tetratricopeptide (TPR) repeat protein